MSIAGIIMNMRRAIELRVEYRRMESLHRGRIINADLGLSEVSPGSRDEQAVHATNIVLLRRAIASEQRMWDRTNLTFHEQTHQRQKPYRFFRLQTELLRYIQGSTIVEIGSARARLPHPINEFNPVCCNDGHSTYHWASQTDMKVHTVDIDPESRKNLDRAGFANLTAVTGDGIAFLREWKGPPIDFLFLDAWDIGVPQYAEKHLEAYEVIKDRLAARHVIGIDDTDFSGDGKGKLLVPHLLASGYLLVAQGRQTVFTNFDIGPETVRPG